MNPSTPQAAASRRELLQPISSEWIVVAHKYYWGLEAAFSGLLHVVQALRQTHTLLQGDFVADLDGGAVGHGVRERHAELDHVGATFLQC